jgi:site-specific DNA-methyltransferase (adenine-specific)|tara:strand:- start:1045 stop:1440 length:396 start_codon:yes stop_codon:yes gene_type:complete
MPYINKSQSDDWLTPKEVYEKLDEEFEFNFDPCPYPLPEFDGLKIEWKERNFVNPPYSELKKWIKKSFEEYKKGKLVVMLIPSRTDTIAWHEYIFPYAKVRFIKGRLKFKLAGATKIDPAPFPSAIVIFKQ